MTKRIAVPAEAVRTREQILAGVTVTEGKDGQFVWVQCWNCGGRGTYPSSMIPAGMCRLYCWNGRTKATYGKLAMPLEKFVKRAMANDRRDYRARIRYELDTPARLEREKTGNPELAVGETAQIRATVKEHTEYRGERQTVVQRVKAVAA